uniref:MULE transposase domain-containing protein n=1 Tax=Lactuca sativa TaxID=4236 RepID=A0A9R1WWA5_LACSA|nr:hypothetical protein LSAT_V11C800449890 [Lactuca sativa]
MRRENGFIKFYDTKNEELYLANSKFESYDELLKSDMECLFEIPVKINMSHYNVIEAVPIEIICVLVIKGRTLDLIVDKKNLTRNHEPSTDISGHPSFRQLSPTDVQIVKNMTLSGIPPRQILSSLRQANPNLPAVSQTIYNLKAKICKENLGNRSMVSALFEEFEKEGFIYDILHNSIGHITHLFIVHPLSIKLAKSFSNIFIMDCTYKTNKYNMPLLDIIGVSCFNTSFYSGFVFLKREDEDSVFKKTLENREPSVIMSDRELALMNAINMVFSNTINILCIWHIEKNVLANCNKHFAHTKEFNLFMSSWNNVAYSTTTTIFEHNWGEFELFYLTKKVVIEYIKKWLPWKEKFVSAWTEKYLHFGNRSSSRAEGAHTKLKQYLQVSTCGFQDVTKKICLAIKHEFNEIKVKLASTMNPCTGHFMATMTLPCAHKIKHLEGMTWRIDTLRLHSEDGLHNDGANEFGELLSELSSRYQMWPQSKKEFAKSMITKLLAESDTLFDPIICRPKGRPPKSKNKRGINSTAQHPSRFEFVESSQIQKASSSTHVFQMRNELSDNIDDISRENNLLDLNAYPIFSSDDIPLDCVFLLNGNRWPKTMYSLFVDGPKKFRDYTFILSQF